MTAAELKGKLPLPELMARCGDGDRAKKLARCPFHEDRSPSFSVFQRDGLWFFKCHAGCGEGDEVHYLQRKFAVDTAGAFAKWKELAGGNGNGHGNAPPSRPASPPAHAMKPDKETSDQSGAWRKCCAAFTDDHAVKLAAWRGYSADFVAWLRQRELAGLYEGKIAFPVSDGGKVLAIHYRIPPETEGEKARWAYWPKGVGVRLLAIGDVTTAENVAVFESQWDLLAVADKLGVHRKGGLPGWAFAATRGADNAKLLAEVVSKSAVVFAFAQNDQAGREWLQAAADAIGRPVRAVKTPDRHKDAADWCKAGASLADISGGIENATEAKPDAKAAKASGLVIVSAMDLVNATFPDTEDIVAGIWPTKSRLILSAPAKLGKTRFMLGMALGIATGKDVLGFTVTKPRRVLYFQAEVSARGLQDRLKKMLAVFPADEALVRENLLFCNDPRLKLTRDDAVAAIREAVGKHRPEASVFDPLYKFNTGSEDKVQDMTAFFDPLDTLLTDYGVAVALVHHHGKGRGEHLTTTAHLNRGSSTIADWPDSLLTLQFENAAEDIVKLSVVLRNADEPEPVAYQRNRDTLWFDPLPDYAFTTKGAGTRIANESVADTIGTGREVAHSILVKELVAKFDVCERTAASAIKRAAEAGVVVKNLRGLYERAG